MRVFVFFISSKQCFLSTHEFKKGTVTGHLLKSSLSLYRIIQYNLNEVIPLCADSIYSLY